MAETKVLEIHVDHEVRLKAQADGRKVVDSLRRQLRLPNIGEEKQSREALSLFETKDGEHHLAAGLLPKLTETCRRQGIEFSVIDERSLVNCPPLRSRQRLSEQEQEGMRQLLLRDNGVIIAPADTVLHLTAELIARRQQRTLILTLDDKRQAEWLSQLSSIFNASVEQITTLEKATDHSRVLVATYSQTRQIPTQKLSHCFGQVLLDNVDLVDAITLRQIMRSLDARYVLGMAQAASRSDGLQQHLFTALGGIHLQILGPPRELPLRLSSRFQTTQFNFRLENKSQYQALIAALAADEKRNRQIVDDIISEASAGQSCLVLSERRDHLEALAAMLPDNIKTAGMTSTVRPAERARLLEQFDRGEITVLFCTSQIATESFSSTTLTRLFLTFPFASAQKLQKAVRCLLAPAPQQQEAILYDYNDAEVPTLQRAFDKRRQVISRLTLAAEEELARRAQLELPF